MLSYNILSSVFSGRSAPYETLTNTFGKENAMKKMIGLTILLVCVAVAGCTTTRIPSTHSPIPMSIGNPVPLDMTSKGVTWRDNVYYLLQFSSITFKVENDAVLSATIKGHTACFDNVDYTVHCAVFDESGRLLSTASTIVEVKRRWAGFMVTLTDESHSLDFGELKSYEKAKYFSLAISAEVVLTPDEWNAEPEN
jgi:hypothetical protein